ncbi:MFS transporter [Pedococcus ginsenosidimutans]
MLRTPRSRAAVVVVLCLVQFVDVLGVTAAIVAIPSMLDGVGAGDAAAGPIATAYAMLFGGLLVVGARLGHRYGHVRMLLVGLVVFALAGATGALAQHAWQLVLARAVQGAASALTVPAALSLLLAAATATGERTKALGLWSAAGAAAGASGLFAGGLLIELFGWRAIFWVNVPLAVGLAAGVRYWVHVRPVQDTEAALDVVGATLLVAAVMGVVLGAALVQEAHSRVLGLVVVLGGVVLGLLLVAWLRRARGPLVSLSSLRAPHLLAGTLGSFVNTAVTSSTAVLLTLYLQRRHGFSAFEAGLTLLALSLAVVIGASAAPRLSRGYGPRRPAVVGLGSMTLGNLVVAVTTFAGDSLATFAAVAGTIVGLLLLGTGLGLSSVAFNDIGTDLPEHEVATATGVLNTGAQLGTAIGVAALLLVGAPGTYGPIPAVSVAVGLAALLGAGATRVVVRWRPD